MADGSLFNEIMLEEKLVELWSDYSCLLPRKIAGFQEQDFKNLGETFTHVCVLFCNQWATIARIVSKNCLSNR